MERERAYELIRRCYSAFNSRDLDAALAGMHPDVDWPNALEGGRVRGHEAVRRYWLRQFESIDPHVEPTAFAEDDRGRIAVDVHQIVRDLDGHVIADQDVRHLYTFRDGLVVRMEIEAGLDAADRARLSERLRAAGASGDELTEAIRSGTLGVLALDLALRPAGPMVPFSEAAADAGLSEQEAASVWRALGLAVPADGSLRLTSDEAALLGVLVALGRQVVGEDRALGFARVLGSATAVLAEALVDAFRVQTEIPRLQAGERYADIVEDFVRLAQAEFPTFVHGLGVLTRAHMLRVARGVWAPDEQRAAVTREQTIGFADLVGYTGRSRTLSTAALAVAMGRFETQVADLVSRFGGRLVKFIGDEAMFVTPDPAAGCELALALIDSFAADPHLPPIRVGLAHGAAVALHGDYYGEVVNLAARLVESAHPSQVVVAESVKRAAAYDFRFEPASAQALKGFQDPVAAFILTGRNRPARVFD